MGNTENEYALFRNTIYDYVSPDRKTPAALT